MNRYGTPDKLKFIDAIAPFAQQAASEGYLERFLGHSYLMFIKQFPMEDEHGNEEMHPDAELFFRRREKEYIMDLLGSIAWECYACSSISLPCTWSQYLETIPEDREHINSTLRPLYEEAHERCMREEAAKAQRRAEAEAERLRLEDEEDEKRWVAWGTAPVPKLALVPGSTLETPIVIEDLDDFEEVCGP